MSARFVALLAVFACAIAGSPPLQAADNDRVEDEERTLVAGTVTDSDGLEIAGARVLVIDPLQGLTLDEAISDESGWFELSPMKTSSYLARACFLRADSIDGKAMHLGQIGVVEDGRMVFPEEPLELKLSPVIEPTIAVQNADGEPVGDCPVIMQAGGFNIRLTETTGTDGKVTFKIPNDATVSQIFAWKDCHGFAFRSYLPDRRSNAANAEDPPRFDPSDATMRLSGFRSIRVRLVDEDNKPLEGHAVHPWLLNSPERVSSINLSFLQNDFSSTTDENGVADFDWIPDWQTRRMTFWNSGSTGWTHRRVTVDPNAAPGSDGVHATLQIERLVPFSGRVVDQEGNPVPDALVTLAGEYNERHFSDLRTDADGQYKTKVPPGMNFLITAKQKSGEQTVAVADTIVGLVVFPGKPFQAPDLVLREPTIVSGVLKDANGELMPDEKIISYHYGITYSELPAEVQQQLSRPRYQAQPIAFNYATTDAVGRFEFALGNGRYDFRPPNQRSAEKLEITDEKPQTIELTYEKEEEPQDTFAGKVVLSDGTPVANIVVEAIADNFRNGWRTTTDKNGEFSVQEHRGRKSIKAVTKDQTHGAIVSVAENQSSQTITLQPTGSVRLTLLDKKGGPVAFRNIEASETLHSSQRGSFRSRPFGTAETDGEGVVEFTKLIPNAIYSCYFAERDRRGGRRILARFKVQPGEVYETVADVALNPPEPRPFAPPTNEDRLKRWLSVDGTPVQRFEKALRKIMSYDQKLLIIIGRESGDHLTQWVSIRYGEREYSKLSADYATIVLAIDKNQEGVTQLLDRLDQESPVDSGLTFLMIDSSGRVIERAGPDELNEDDQLSVEKVLGFLGRYPIVHPSAEEQYEAALAQAKAEDKCIFVQETATWCGPCHMLTDFLLANRIWEKDYVYVRMDHRMEGAFEFMKQLRDGAEGGIPWFVILDSDGNKQITSNSFRNDRNIGFPSSSQGREHFKKMIQETAKRMTKQEINDFVALLSDPD